MAKSIIQLVDELPEDNITVKVLKALDFVAPGEWNNLIGFDATIAHFTGETDPKTLQRIRDRAAALYLDPTKGYQGAVQLYQAIDKADVAMGTAALANKVSEKLSFLSFLGNLTPKAETTQTIDLLLKIAVEVIAFCKLNGIPQPNPQLFANSLAKNYHNAGLIRMVALVCIDGLLPLGPNFLTKIHVIIQGINPGNIAGNPVFSGIKDQIPGKTIGDRLGFVNQCFSAIEGWMNQLIAKTGITPEGIFNHLGNFIQMADDNLDFVAAFLDQTTNYYEHTGIQTVAQRLILEAYKSLQADGEVLRNEDPDHEDFRGERAIEFSIGDTVEVWDKKEEDWYEATIRKVKVKKDKPRYYVHYVGYGASEDEWIKEKNVRAGNFEEADDNGYAVGQKVKVWDDDDEEWYTARIQKIDGNQYRVHYLDEDDFDDEWVDLDEIC
ncbi:MAG: hypothetical protein J7540_13965 [Roseofilum sp. SID2]|uniref:Tudor-knot domain-containing protein n=1 Tax=unclassified Roseofilum TaxID=2620099 RepID=UPI001B0836E3|nr:MULTISPECIES: Tudor-knot domain-containing protein [unclassified Roseofilum]MBP0011925.1 hypothetical protein [Roseofilum sp. SID3]MBP0025091.1 hypothetical protein [Roseofilum sp. SID2]